MPVTKKTAKRRAPRRAARKPAAAVQPQPGPVRQLWLAGLGAAITSGEIAVGLVDELVDRGRRQEPKARAVAGEIVDTLRGGAETLVRRATTESRKVLDRTMKQMGVQQQPPRQKNILHRLGDLAEALL